MRFPRTLLTAFVAAAVLAPALPARAGGDDKKKDEKKEEKKGGNRKEEEKAKEEEEARRKKEAEMKAAQNGENWDDREGDHACPWPDVPDVDEMLADAKAGADAKAIPPPAADEGPGIGGYRTPEPQEPHVAEAVSGEFGEGEGGDLSWLEKSK